MNNVFTDIHHGIMCNLLKWFPALFDTILHYQPSQYEGFSGCPECGRFLVVPVFLWVEGIVCGQGVSLVGGGVISGWEALFVGGGHCL